MLPERSDPVTRPALEPDTKLERLPELELILDSSNAVFVVRDGERIACGPHGLLVLDAFNKPVSMREALEQLKPHVSGMQDWVALSHTIDTMRRAGILRDPTESRPALERTDDTGWDAAPVHVRMLNDTRRVQRYQQGIRAVVRPGDVVVDVGTGTGILAIEAAKAGARHVYAVEASGIGRLARAMFAANELADRITLIPGWSTRIDLPERADVLVSEIIGDDPLAENVRAVVADARRRFLAPHARVLPRRLRILGVGVDITAETIGHHVFTAAMAQTWASRYQMRFDPLGRMSQIEPHRFFVWPHKTREWELLSEPIVLADLDLGSDDMPRVRTSNTLSAVAGSALNGLLVYFELEIAPDLWLSTHPRDADEHCSWRNMAWILPEDTTTASSRSFAVTYAYDGLRGSHIELGSM